MSGLPMVGDEFAGYRVRSVLGRGGMSVVYQAENLRLSSVIALKVLAPELAADDVFRARFLEESRIAASLNHPNVIPIYDMGSQDDLLYIAMRYVSGTDMRQMIKKRGRILPATALFLVGQAARALDAAHRRGLVHRDVKPGNLLIERGSDEADPDHVYLADFGITKHAMSRSGLTSTGQFLGTIDYVAPEQIRGMSVLGMADQYSLGCVLYECLTGRVPFEKDLDAAIIWAHVEETPTRPTVLRPELPPEIDEVFNRVLAKRPDERYGTCREFVDAARLALGVLGPGTESSPAFGPTMASPQVEAPPGGQTGAPPRRFSWSNVPGQSQPSNPSAPDSVAAASSYGPEQSWDGQPSGSQSGYTPPGYSPPGYGQPSGSQPGYSPPDHGQGRAAQSGGTLTSHRRQFGIAGPGEPGQPAGAQPPPGGPQGPRWYRQPRWIAVLAALILVLAGVGTWAGLSGSGSHTGHGNAAVKNKPKKAAPSALMSALMVTNQIPEVDNMLPPSTCKQQGSNKVTCTAPSAGITDVAFQTYPNLTALYNAYMAKVMSLSSSGQFQQNYKDCGLEQTVGEVAWNHQFQHPKTYTVDKMMAGKVTDDQAVGRVYCNFAQGLEYIVWTQDDGNLMGVVMGAPHESVWNWWVAIHHNIGLGGMNMNMGSSASPSMGSTPSSGSSSMAPSPAASMSSMSG